MWSLLFTQYLDCISGEWYSLLEVTLEALHCVTLTEGYIYATMYTW